ncbi:MAG: DNA primase [Holosporales bacterium]|jgi:DNA primase|nr:DNA primase [Holosporales bacterium]
MRTTDLNVILDNIRSKVALSEIVGRDVKLIRKGRELVGHCPFHSEKTASFFVNDEKGKYYCFGCGAKGDIFSYIVQSKGVTFMQAVEQMAHEIGVKLPAHSFKELDNNYKNIMDECSKFFARQLLNNNEVLEYCHKRGLDQETIRLFQIGFCPQNILPLMEKIGYPAVKEAWVTKFTNRLIFPITDPRGSIIAFGARTLQKDEQPKYINSAESAIFQKREVLYGYNIASKNVSKNNQYIVVEGYMDVVMMHKFGFHTTVASMGTSFSSEHLLNLWRHCNEPIICFDGDEAGYSAMQRAAYVALEYIQPGKTLRFCKMPSGYDPDLYIREKSVESMEILLKNSLYLIDFLWENFTDAYSRMVVKTPEYIAAWRKEIVEKLFIINNIELRNLYISAIKDRIRAVNKGKREMPRTVGPLFVDKKNNALLREAILLYVIVKDKAILPEIAEQLSCIIFSNDFLENVKDCLLNERELHDDDVIKLGKIAGKYCNFSQDNSLDFWYDVYRNHVFRDEYSRDLKLAEEEFKKDLRNDSWERLRALKLNLSKK